MSLEKLREEAAAALQSFDKRIQNQEAERAAVRNITAADRMQSGQLSPELERQIEQYALTAVRTPPRMQVYSGTNPSDVNGVFRRSSSPSYGVNSNPETTIQTLHNILDGINVQAEQPVRQLRLED